MAIGNLSEVMSGQKKERIRSKITPEEFVRAWQTSANVSEVADKLGIPKENCMVRASTYRYLGIKLKHMPRGNVKSIDVAKLNEIIADLGGSKSDEQDTAEAVDAARQIPPDSDRKEDAQKAKTRGDRIRQII